MTGLLAATNGGGDGVWISVAAITAIGGVIIGIIKAFRAGVEKGKAAQDNNVTLKKPVPTIQTREEPQWATEPDLKDHIERTDRRFNEVWEAIQTERGIARTALGKIHERIDLQSKATATLQGTVEAVAKNVDKLLDLALGRKPSPRQ